MDRLAPFTHCQIVPGTCARPPAYLLRADFLVWTSCSTLNHFSSSVDPNTAAFRPRPPDLPVRLSILIFLWCLHAPALLRAITIAPARLRVSHHENVPTFTTTAASLLAHRSSARPCLTVCRLLPDPSSLLPAHLLLARLFPHLQALLSAAASNFYL